MDTQQKTTDPRLTALGTRLESVDRHMVHLIARRMRLAEQVAMIKLEAGLELYRPQIEQDRLDDASKWAKEEGVNPEFARSMLYGLIGESCKRQIELTDRFRLQGNAEKFTPSREELRSNLLALTDAWAPRYDADYGKSHPATAAFMRYERKIIDQTVPNVPEDGIVIDIGCATGRESRRLASQFKAIHGLDLSERMIEQGRKTARDENIGNVSFDVTDAENGLPFQSGSASFVIMNGGTGSDMFELHPVLSEIQRVLKPHGKFVASFYNKEAWIQRAFMPWPLGLVAGIDLHRSCLEVYSGSRLVPIHAKPYTSDEIESLLPSHLETLTSSTYPAVSSILPSEILKATGSEIIERLDERIAQDGTGLGAYVVVTGEKV
ncbi:MAG TPA: methyltransferase domain-containing protein [Candidatus Paceibacterota bacterium]|nr:methyltransferase domain-containing protein [Candidatus Paceibacterota bacterium]